MGFFADKEILAPAKEAPSPEILADHPEFSVREPVCERNLACVSEFLREKWFPRLEKKTGHGGRPFLQPTSQSMCEILAGNSSFERELGRETGELAEELGLLDENLG